MTATDESHRHHKSTGLEHWLWVLEADEVRTSAEEHIRVSDISLVHHTSDGSEEENVYEEECVVLSDGLSHANEVNGHIVMCWFQVFRI